MAQGPMISNLVTIRITFRIQESVPDSEIRIHWIIDYAGVRRRSALSMSSSSFVMFLMIKLVIRDTSVQASLHYRVQ